MDNGQLPATKQDIAEVRQEIGDVKQDVGVLKQDVSVLKEDVGGLKQDVAILRSEMNHQYDGVREAIRDSQAEVLKAFYNFAETNNKRIAHNEGDESALRSRVETLERRVFELERRLNLPPAA